MTADRSAGVVRPSSDRLEYEVDSTSHRVVARYSDGSVAFSFGSQGHRAGQFDTPLHIVQIWPAFSGEPLLDGCDLSSLLTPWLAVADYGNHRVQFFECDGAYIGESNCEPSEPPCHLSWRSPVLEVTTIEGRSIRIHVAAALLTTSRRGVREERQTPSDPRRVWRVC